MSSSHTQVYDKSSKKQLPRTIIGGDALLGISFFLLFGSLTYKGIIYKIGFFVTKFDTQLLNSFKTV